jgi:antitoxin component YwqK of YwqJK toxin-antitoxin module
MPARDHYFYGAFKVTRFLIGNLIQFNEIANLRRGVITNFNMKDNYQILFIFICIFFGNTLSSQVLVIRKDTSITYKDSKMNGQYFKGVKIGQWKELSKDGVIYSESNYDSAGNHIGIWKINFPDGSPRCVTECSDNNPVKFAIYRYKRKIAEVSSETKIPEETYQSLDKFENNMFQYEKVSLETWSVGYSGTPYQGMNNYQMNPFEHVNDISKILASSKYTGALIIWNSNNTINNKREFNQGSEYKTAYFYNKKKEITKQEEYKDNKIIKTITFKANGEQKIKTY